MRTLTTTVIALALLCLQGCVVTSTVGLAADVAEGAVKTTVFTAKTTGRVVGAAVPGGDGDEEGDRDRRR